MKSLKILLSLVFIAALSKAEATESKIKAYKSPQGTSYWILEEHSLPIVGISVGFKIRPGTTINGKSFVPEFASSILSRTAGSLDSVQFSEYKQDNGLELKVGPPENIEDLFFVSGKTPSETLDQSVQAMKWVLQQPRLEPDDMKMTKNQMSAYVASLASSTEGISDLVNSVFPDYHFSKPVPSVVSAIQSVEPEDILTFCKKVFRKSGMIVNFAGDVSPEKAGKIVDELVAGLPEASDLDVTPRTIPLEIGTTVFEYPESPRTPPQALIKILIPWHKATNPDIFSTRVALQVLGLGGFSSRLFQEVREKRGLAYDVSTIPQHSIEGDVMVVSMGVDNSKVKEALTITYDVWDDFIKNGITEEEFQQAVQFLVGAIPGRMSSIKASMGYLTGFQHLNNAGSGIDYLAVFPDKMAELTIEKVNADIKKYFGHEQAQTVIIGRPQGIKADRIIKIGEFFDQVLK